MRVNDVVTQQIALFVQADYLTAGAEAGVNGHHALLPHRRGQQQLPEVLSKHLDAFNIGLLFGLSENFSGDGRVQKALPGVVHGVADLVMRGVAVLLAIVVIQFVAALLSVGINLHLQKTFILCPQHSEEVVGRDLGDGLREVEIRAVFGRLGIGHTLLGYLGTDPAGAVDAAQRLPVMGGLADSFCQDIPGALQSLFHGGYLALDKLLGIGLRITALVVPKEIREGFQAPGDRHGGARLAFGPIREIQVFQLAAAHAVLYGLLQLRRQLPQLLNGSQDGSLAFFHLFKDIGPMLDLGHLHVCHSSRALLAVPGDERDGAPLCKQFHAVFHLPVLDVQVGSDIFDV